METTLYIDIAGRVRVEWHSCWISAFLWDSCRKGPRKGSWLLVIGRFSISWSSRLPNPMPR